MSILANSQHADVKKLVFLLMLLLWAVLPFFVWLIILCLVAVFLEPLNQLSRGDVVLAILLSFSLSIMISSREVGMLWNGVDDMPAYLNAYDHFTELKSIIAVSVRYSFHADIAFAFYSWLVATLTDHHRYFYFFITVFFTYSMIFMFVIKLTPRYFLICFLLIIIYFKFFHFQWHLIRSMLALPMIMYGLYAAIDRPWKGRAIVIIGGLFHFSTFAMSLPLLIVAPLLKKRFSLIELIFIFGLLLLTIGAVFAISVYLADYSSLYMLSKILQRLKFEPSFSKLPYLVFFVAILIFSYIAYVRTEDQRLIRVFNMMYYYSLLGGVALFIAGDELYRFIMPLFILYGPVLVLAAQYLFGKGSDKVFLLIVLLLQLSAFSYVLKLDDAHFFYMTDKSHEPIVFNGIQQIMFFSSYINSDIEYYK